jgi:hypothetical protein
MSGCSAAAAAWIVGGIIAVDVSIIGSLVEDLGMQVCVVEATGNVARFRKEDENAAVDNPSCAGRRRRVGMMASMTNAADIFVGEAIRDNIVRPGMGDRNRSATMAMADMMLLRHGVCPFSMVDLYIIRCSRYRAACARLLRNESAFYQSIYGDVVLIAVGWMGAGGGW